jgi:hypothetical protein
MLRKSMSVLLVVVVLALGFAVPAFASAAGGRPGSLGEVYVSSQGLYYDTFVTVEALPQQGPFELLTNHVAEFGPGQQGYFGGRWWVDVNGDGIQDAGDMFLLCPLLGPGSPTP